jgi:hypothetical protein
MLGLRSAALAKRMRNGTQVESAADRQGGNRHSMTRTRDTAAPAPVSTCFDDAPERQVTTAIARRLERGMAAEMQSNCRFDR